MSFRKMGWSDDKEAAELLHVTPDEIREMTRNGILLCHRLGDEIFYWRPEVAILLGPELDSEEMNRREDLLEAPKPKWQEKCLRALALVKRNFCKHQALLNESVGAIYTLEDNVLSAPDRMPPIPRKFDGKPKRI